MKKLFAKRTVCRLLATLDKAELRDFENFLLYRGKANTTKLWQRLKREHPDFAVGDETVFKAVHPGKPYKDAAFRIWVADLYSAAREYIAFQQFKEDKHLFHNTLALGLLWRKDSVSYGKLKREQEKLYGAKQVKSVDWHQYLFQMDDLDYQYTTLFHHRAATDSLQKAAYSLDLHLLATKLKYLVVMHNRERITNEVFDYRLEEEILAYLTENPQREQPVIHLYFLLVCLFKEITDKGIFQQFLDFFTAKQDQIEQSESRQLLTSASNIAYWNIQLGNLDYLTLRFSLIKIMVEEQFLLIKGVFPSYHFSNVIRAAILVGQADWGMDFLAANIGRTPEISRDNLSTYNRAFLHFAKGDYDKQVPFMLEMQATDYRFADTQANISYRILSIKTAYKKLGGQPSASLLHDYRWHMDAFRYFIRELPDVSEDFQLSCKHFHQAMAGIFRMHYGERKKLVTREGIVGLQPIVELPWLLGEV